MTQQIYAATVQSRYRANVWMNLTASKGYSGDNDLTRITWKRKIT